MASIKKLNTQKMIFKLKKKNEKYNELIINCEIIVTKSYKKRLLTLTF